MGRAGFLLRMIRQRFSGEDWDCPYCAQSNTHVIGKKRLVLQLRRCADCGLMFRWPKDTTKINRVFYQHQYRECMVTDVTERASVEKLKPSCLFRPQNALADRIAVLRMLMAKGRVLDFGCSWGYGTFQLMNAGYDAIGFEISEPRARVGRMRLGVTVISRQAELEQLAGSFDAVFASHVLEHVPAPAAAFDCIARMLKPGGIFLAFVPNCGGEEACRLGARWGPMCCEKHPLAYDARFLAGALPKHGFRAITMFSNPYPADYLTALSHDTGERENLGGAELLVIARRSFVETIKSC